MNTNLKTLPLALCIAAVFAVLSCSNNTGSSSRKDIQALDVAAPNSQQPSQTNVTKMEREAELKFRVKDVGQSTGILEKMAVANGGYVAKSFFDIDESETLIKKLSTDSAQEIKKLNQRNHLEVFVLNSKLDSFLDKIKPLVDHLEFRHVSANDVVMESSHEKDKSAAGGTVYADYSLDSVSANHFKANTNSWVSPKTTVLKTRFARVTMDIYQTPVVKKWVIPNPDSFEVARGGFWEDFVASLKTGMRGTMIFFNLLVSFWPLWLLLVLGWYLWRRKTKKSFWPSIRNKKSA